MLEHLIAVMMQPDEYLYAWRDGELYVRPAPELETASSDSSPLERDEQMAA
jgi:hypothetical protein